MSTTLSRINSNLQLHALPFPLENQSDFLSYSPPSSAVVLGNTSSLLKGLPTLPTSIPSSLNITTLSSALFPLTQPIKEISKGVILADNQSRSNKLQQPPAIKTVKKKRNRQRCPIFLSFIKDWINQGYYFGSFCKCMEEAYLVKGLPKDDETYDEHETCRRVYLTKQSGNKYTLHYSLISPNGTLIQHKYALSSLKRIFKAVEQNLKG